jgi:hypothetical protein
VAGPELGVKQKLAEAPRWLGFSSALDPEPILLTSWLGTRPRNRTQYSSRVVAEKATFDPQELICSALICWWRHSCRGRARAAGSLSTRSGRSEAAFAMLSAPSTASITEYPEAET